MPVITLSNGLYSNAGEIATQICREYNCSLITDQDIIDTTSQKYHIKPSTIRKVMESKAIAFNDFTHEKEKCTACLKRIVALQVRKGNCLLHGMSGHLIPKHISHVLRILVITDRETRIRNGMQRTGKSRKETEKDILNSDKYSILWTTGLTGKKAFDSALYDIVIPTDKLDVPQSIELILKHGKRFCELPEALVEKEAADFDLASRVEVALAGAGSRLSVEADDGNILITIDKNVMMLAKFKQKITQIAQSIEGVKSVETKLGKNYYSNTMVRNLEVETPLRLLLVDDEKEFVQTLSERLKLRQFPSEIAYDGEQALEFTDKEDTEVMILDLKMPGIDGIEVLKKIKETRPEIEVIILTGHGSDQDRKTCMELGAFAYLEKPADIDLLTATMKKAYEKINKRKKTSAGIE
jgi:CheY-like chemotaxis protein